MPKELPVINSEAAHSAFRRLAINLFFELDLECRLNAAFVLPTRIAPTFAAAQEAYAVWMQAVDTLTTENSEEASGHRSPPYL